MIDEKKLVEDIKEWSKEKEIKWTSESVISLLESAPKTDGWIPCSERLPEEPASDEFYGMTDVGHCQEYIVMVNGAEESTTLKYIGDNEWYYNGVFYDVIAWQPLPAPYAEESGG